MVTSIYVTALIVASRYIHACNFLLTFTPTDLDLLFLLSHVHNMYGNSHVTHVH